MGNILIHELSYKHKNIDILKPYNSMVTPELRSMIHRDVRIVQDILNIDTNISVTLEITLMFKKISGLLLNPIELPINKDYYHLVLNPTLFTRPTPQQYLLTIAHEMVHVKQYVNNEFIFHNLEYDNFGLAKPTFSLIYNNTVYSFETIDFIRQRNLDYKFLPWEKEAYGKEQAIAVELERRIKDEKLNATQI